MTVSLSGRDGPHDAQLIEEHRLIARRIEQASAQIEHLCSAPANRTPSEIKRLIELLEGLIETALAHFQHEEAQMTKDGFPGFAFHKRDHDNFIGSLTDLTSSLSLGTVPVSTGAGEKLRGWLTYHVKRYDEAYAAFAEARKPGAEG